MLTLIPLNTEFCCKLLKHEIHRAELTCAMMLNSVYRNHTCWRKIIFLNLKPEASVSLLPCYVHANILLLQISFHITVVYTFCLLCFRLSASTSCLRRLTIIPVFSILYLPTL